MDLQAILGELLKEKEKLERAIAALQELESALGRKSRKRTSQRGAHARRPASRRTSKRAHDAKATTHNVLMFKRGLERKKRA